MKKNRMMRLASILLVCVLLSTSVISGTFAKYVSEAEATDTAYVAKWSFMVGEKNIATEDEIVFDLFETIYDSNGTDEEGDVAEGMIAPGTCGEFTIEIENTSDVTARYAIAYTVTDDVGAHLVFSVDGGETWTDTLASVAASEDTELEAGAAADDITVQWKWAYEDSTDEDYDTDDTDIGIAAAAAATGSELKLEVTAKITATQVD